LRAACGRPSAGDDTTTTGDRPYPPRIAAHRLPEVDKLVGGLHDLRPLLHRGGRQQPGDNHRPLVSNATSTWSSTTCEDRIEKVSSDSGIMTAWQPSFSPG
jgi:hypothetical protein